MKSKTKYCIHIFLNAFGWILGALSFFYLISPMLFQNNSGLIDFLFMLLTSVATISVLIGSIIYTNLNYSYIRLQMKYMKKAKRSIYIVFRSLSPESNDRLYKIYDEMLQQMNNKEINVKIITSSQIVLDRLIGATQIYNKEIGMRFLPELKDNDLRYMLIDEETIVISQQEMETREPSREAVVIRSKRLGQMLKKDFDAKWEKGIHFKKYYEMCTKDFVRRRQIPCELEKENHGMD